MKRVLKIDLSILPYLLIFIASLYLPKDPDLGWHLKYGQYFFDHRQILRDNIFSTMMPNYHWANGSWGTDILTYLIFKSGGFFGLIITSALIVTCTYFIFAKAAQLSRLEEALFAPLLVYLEASKNSNSFRGEQISLLFLGVLFLILSRYKPPSKTLLCIPIFFLLWCNIQEESFLGLALFGIWIGLTLIREFFTTQKNRKTFFKHSIFWVRLFILTVLTTFVNPFGWGIHLIAVSHLRDPMLNEINEYIPFAIFSLQWWSQITMTVIIIAGMIYLLYKKVFIKFIPIFGLPLLLLLLTFSVRRYAWPAYYLMLPFLHVLVQPLEKYIKKYALTAALVISFIGVSFALFLKNPFNQFTKMSWNTYCSIKELPCSPQSAEYLQTIKLTHNIFTFYDWGGWLIWNYPNIKPSIDGRMHVWQDKNGYSAFTDYDKYINAEKSIDQSPFNVIYIPVKNVPQPFSEELSRLIEQHKWKVIYDDNLAGIIVRNKK